MNLYSSSNRCSDELRSSVFSGVWKARRVLITGHTGFKGSWLTEWLLLLGAEVHGFALAPATEPAIFEQLRLATRVARHTLGDLRDRAAVAAVFSAADPEVVFHMAAQPLVRLSYAEPVETYATNIMGTVHVLEAARQAVRPCAVIVVTTDKCYENREWIQGYREDDALGGHDPYSSSKAAAELVTAAYRRSFFETGLPVAVASARAGNVIGGGDWATDRILPDCMRALARGETIKVRNAGAMRPWQHVLEPLGGYLLLAGRLAEAQGCGDREALRKLSGAFNFGPTLASNRKVEDVVTEVVKHWPGKWKVQADAKAPHEAGRLMLAIDKAHHLLGWNPIWSFAESVARTVRWYQSWHRNPLTVRELTTQQIQDYLAGEVIMGRGKATQ